MAYYNMIATYVMYCSDKIYSRIVDPNIVDPLSSTLDSYDYKIKPYHVTLIKHKRV